MAAMRPDQKYEDLDMEYLQILRRIKPYITSIMNNHYIELIRVWLEKLSDINLEDKKMRNTYLIELGKQIEIGIFEAPFIDLPPKDNLPAYKDTWKSHKPDKGNETVKIMWPYITSNNNSKQTLDVSSSSQINCSYNATIDGSTYQNASSSDIKGTKSNFYVISPVNCISSQQKIKCKNTHKFSEPQIDALKKKLQVVENYSKELCNNVKSSKRRKQKLKKQHNLYTVPNKYSDSVLDSLNFQEYFQPALPETDIDRYSNAKKPKQRRLKHKSNEHKENDSDGSWFDLTEVSTNTVFGSGDTELSPKTLDNNDTIEMQNMYESKIANLVNIIDDLKKENKVLTQHMDKYEKDLSLRNTKAETSLHNLASEVECLKSRLQELVDTKLSLQNSHFAVTTEWQNTITTLHKKLNSLQIKNNELKSQITEYEKKLNDVDVERRKEIITQKKKLSEFHAKETDMLKQIHARAITDMEAKYNKKLQDQNNEFHKQLDNIKDNYENRLINIKDDYDNRICNIRSEYENRISNINMEFDKLISNKDCEIERLEGLLQEQCLRMQEEVQVIRSQVESNVTSNNETYLDKISFLQKCILKMEKLYQKSERDNFKQVSKLKRELDYRDKSNQLALTTQRADLMSHTFSGRQNEIDVIAMQLEEHYKKILLEQQKKAIEDKKHDATIICDLKEQLSKCRIEF